MTKKESGIAAVILALLAVSLAVLIWGTRLDGGVERLGPLRSFEAGGANHLAVFHDGHLHLLDAQGHRVGRQPLADLLLTEEPNDMDWTVAPDGSVHAWFFEDTLPRIVRCQLDAGRGMRLQACQQMLSGPKLKVNDRSRAVHLAVDEARGRLFVADAKGHAVRALAFDGRHLGDSAQGLLFFPNRLRLEGDSLVVADNDHRRMVWLDVAGDSPSLREQRTLSARAHPAAAAGATKVTDFALLPGPAGEPAAIWMLAVSQGQKEGTVLTYGPGFAPRNRAALPGSDPLWIDRLGDAAVVGDFDGVALYRVGADGAALGAFGQGAFEQELRQHRDRMRVASRWKQAGWICLGVSLVVGFALALRFSEKPGRREAQVAFEGIDAVEAEVPRGKVVFDPQPWYLRRMQALVALAGLLALAILGVFFFVFAHEIGPALQGGNRRWLVPVLALPMLLSIPLALWLSGRVARRRLVLKNGQAQVRQDDRVLASAPVLTVVASPQALLVGNVALPYRTPTLLGKPGRWIFDEFLLTRYLLAHLPPSQRVAQPALAQTQMKRMPWWRWVLIAVPLAAWLGFQLWRVWGRA